MTTEIPEIFLPIDCESKSNKNNGFYKPLIKPIDCRLDKTGENSLDSLLSKYKSKREKIN